MVLVVYGDFTCAACYLASWRADLLADTADPVEWRAVEHHRELPLTGRRHDGAGHHRAEEDWAAVQARLLPGERLPGRPPSTAFSTQAAVAAYAEAYGAGVADRARRLLFEAYWVGGADIGHPEVLRGLLGPTIRSGTSTSAPLREWGYSVTSARGPVTGAAHARIRGWRREWRDRGGATEPLLVAANGTSTTGADALEVLARSVRDRASESHDLPALPAAPASGRYWR
jgi:hypothetical protein